MKFESKQLIEVIGLIAIVLSLLFVAYEIRLTRSVAQAQELNETAELTRSLNEYLSNNADVWAKGCMDEDLTTSEAIVFTKIAESFINLQYTRWRQSGIGISQVPEWLIVGVVARNRYSFPGFDAAWETRIPPPSFVKAVNEEYSALIESNADKYPNARMCGS